MPARTSRRTKYALVLVLFAGLASAILYANMRAARLVSDALTRSLGQQSSVGRIAISPVSGFTLYNFRIGGAPLSGSKELLAVKSISIIPDYRELAHRRIVISAIYIYSPAVNLSRDKAGEWNFKPLMDKLGKPGGVGRKFSIKNIRIIDGSVTAPDGIGLKEIDATVTGLSSINPGPASFNIKAGDRLGNSITAEGSADILGGHRETDARISLTANNLSRYLPKKAVIEGLKVTAVVNTHFKGGELAVRVSGIADGIRPFKDKPPYAAGFNTGLSYSLSKDVLTIRDASTDVKGLTGLTGSGTVTGLKKNADIDLAAKIEPVDLSRLAGYLPKGTKLAGLITPGNIKVKGSLKPLVLAATCKASISGVSASHKGTGISGIDGLAELSLSPDKAVNARFNVTASGGRLTGTAYYRGAGTFDLKAENIDIGSIDKGVSGFVNTEIKGSFGSSLRDIHAEYRLKVSHLAYKGSAASGNASVEGSFAKNAGGIIFSGVIAGDGAFQEKPLKLKSSYSYSGGGLRLAGISFTGLDGVSLTVPAMDATVKDGAVSVSLKECSVKWKDSVVFNGLRADARTTLKKEGGADLSGSLSASSGTAYGLPVNFVADYSLLGGKVSFSTKAGISDNPLAIRGEAVFSTDKGLIKPAVSGNLKVHNLSFINPLLEEKGLPYSLTAGTAEADFNLDGPDIKGIGGTAAIRAEHIAVGKGDIPVLQEVSTELHPVYREGKLELPESVVKIGERLSIRVSGDARNAKEGWAVNSRTTIPEVGIATLQEELLEFLPPAVKWADTSGTLSLKAGFASSPGQTGKIFGELKLSGVTLSMPDKKIEVGPVDGMVPISYSTGKRNGSTRTGSLDVFDRANYPALLARYSSTPTRNDGLRIKRAYFGLIGLDDISISLEPGDNLYRIEGLKATGFGGSYYGNGLADFSGKTPVYTVSLLISDTSLSEICRRIPPITGYISGRVDGLVRIKLSGGGLEGVTGAGLIWAKDSPLEKREISKELLKKIAGKSLKNYMLLFGGRSFDTGEIDVVFSGGDMVFNRLLISNRNLLGYQDLYITVAPVSNKISLEHLLDVIKNVSERAAGTSPAIAH